MSRNGSIVLRVIGFLLLARSDRWRWRNGLQGWHGTGNFTGSRSGNGHRTIR